MKVRFYIDPLTNRAHVEKHGVSEADVEQILERPMEDRGGSEGSRVAIGVSSGGKHLRVIYVPEDDADSAFVITAYPLGLKAIKALRKRLKGKAKRR